MEKAVEQIVSVVRKVDKSVFSCHMDTRLRMQRMKRMQRMQRTVHYFYIYIHIYYICWPLAVSNTTENTLFKGLIQNVPHSTRAVMCLHILCSIFAFF